MQLNVISRRIRLRSRQQTCGDATFNDLRHAPGAIPNSVTNQRLKLPGEA